MSEKLLFLEMIVFIRKLVSSLAKMTDSENHSRWNFQEGPRSRRVKVTKHQRRKLER